MYEAKHRSLAAAAAILTAVMVSACGSDPVAPTPAAASTPTGATTLKVSAPSIVSPAGGTALNTRNPTLVLRPAVGTYASPTVSYELQVLTTNGDSVYSRTIAGGAANGEGTVSHVVESPLNVRTPYRWRARAVQGANAGPWSDAAAGSVMFVTSSLTPGSSNDEFRDYFFSLVQQKNLTFPSQAAFQAMEPELVGVGIIIAKDTSGFIRGRIYLPTGGADKFARSVDVITGFGPGSSWVWNVRGATKCEGICP
jgi:hypothetical protein